MKNLLKLAYILFAAATITSDSISANSPNFETALENLSQMSGLCTSSSADDCWFDSQVAKQLETFIRSFDLCSPAEQQNIKQSKAFGIVYPAITTAYGLACSLSLDYINSLSSNKRAALCTFARLSVQFVSQVK